MKKEFKPLAAIITDLHIGSKNYNKQLFESQLQFFEEQFFPYLLTNNIKTVFHLGDFFHNRNHADWMILQEIKTRFFAWFEKNDVMFHTIIGNHDSYYKNTIEYNSMVENFKEFKNVIIYTKETIVNLGKYSVWLVPWIVDEHKFEFIDGVDIVMGHFDISGMKMLKNFNSTNGFNRDAFKKYKLVFSGHYHIRSKSGNINYIGTPYQLTWNDFDEPKGFCVLGEDFHFKYIENEINPKHIKILIQKNDDEFKYIVQGDTLNKSIEISEKDLMKLAKQNYARLITESNLSQTDIDNIYNSVNLVSRDGYKIEVINTNEIIEDFDFSELEDSVDDNNILTLISSYIREIEFESSIDKLTLEQIVINLYKEIELGE